MADDTSTRLADNMRRLREWRKLTQQDLSEKSGVPRPTLAHLESGEANPTLSVLVRVAEALETSIEELVGRARAMVTLHPARSLSEHRQTRVRVVDLAPGAGFGFSFQRLELAAGGRVDAVPTTRAGRCFVTLEAGDVVVEAGPESLRLKRGDVAAIARGARHQCRNLGRAAAVLYRVSEGPDAG